MADYEGMVRAFSEGFSERDISRVRAWMHDDVIFDWSRSISDNRGVHQGFGEIESRREAEAALADGELD
jgi:hypothetical protein